MDSYGKRKKSVQGQRNRDVVHQKPDSTQQTAPGNFKPVDSCPTTIRQTDADREEEERERQAQTDKWQIDLLTARLAESQRRMDGEPVPKHYEYFKHSLQELFPAEENNFSERP